MVFSRLFCGLQLPIRWLAHYRKKNNPFTCFTFLDVFISDSGGGGGEMLDSHAFKGNLSNDSTASGDFLDANFFEKRKWKTSCWKREKGNPQSVEFWQITPHFQQYVYQLKTPRLWVVEATMIHLATTIWNLTDLGCLFPKKNPKSVTISNRNQTFSFQIFRTNLPNPSARCWFPCPEPLQGLKLSWSSCLGTGKPSQIDPPQWPKTRWWQLKYLDYFHPETWGRWTHFDEHIFQRGWFNHQLEDLTVKTGFFPTLVEGWSKFSHSWQLRLRAEKTLQNTQVSTLWSEKYQWEGEKEKLWTLKDSFCWTAVWWDHVLSHFAPTTFWMLQFSTSIFLVS